jgi:hypothetical protein
MSLRIRKKVQAVLLRDDHSLNFSWYPRVFSEEIAALIERIFR